MEVVLKGRGERITDPVRDMVDRKVRKLSRLEPRAVRVEVEIIPERNPRLDGAKRVEARLDIPKKSFRAHAEDRDLETAVDETVERLERQLRDFRGKRRADHRHAGNRLESKRADERPAEEVEP